MPDRRRHRGPHPEDRTLFAPDQHVALRDAVADLCWLLGRDYADVAALKLVGDRFGLDARQRIAVRRGACSDTQRDERLARRASTANVRGRIVWIDGFNLLVTVEAAMSGGVLLRCRDGCLRDMASMHGSYKMVEETPHALTATADLLERLGVAECRWLLDRPVSNSGRLRARVVAEAASRGLRWTADLLEDVDRELRAAPEDVLVVTADAGVLDRCGPWADLASPAVAACAPGNRPVNLSC